MELEQVHWRRPGSIFLHGLAYIGLRVLTFLLFLPNRYAGVVLFVAFVFEIEWTAKSFQRGDIAHGLLFASAIIGTIMLVSSFVWLRAWVMRKWDDMTGITWIWRF